MSWLTATWRGKRLSQAAADLHARAGEATTANGEDLLATAQRLVHRRTGRTQASLHLEMTGPLAGQITGRYGAYWLVKRGGAFDFAAQAIAETYPRAKARVRDAVKEAL